MRKVVKLSAMCLALTLLSPPLLSQSPADAARLDRVVALGKLWGAIGLFHPYLAYRSIDWDSALVAALPLVNRAGTREGFAEAVTQMLIRLGDPATRVVPKLPSRPPHNDTDSTPLLRWLPDSVLLVNIAVAAGSGDFEVIGQRLAEVGPPIAAARGVLFDFRVQDAVALEIVNFLWAQSGIDSLLVADTVFGPGQRSRTHSGWTPESGGSSGGYFSAWRISDGTRLLPSRAGRRIPVAVVANSRGALPESIAALVGSGRASLVAEGGPPPNVYAAIARFELPDSLDVEVRLSEAVDRNGRSVTPTVEVVDESPAVGSDNPAFKLALRIARGSELPSGTQNPLPALSGTGAPRSYSEMSYPSREYRVLAALRIYTILEYFHPYRELYGEDWDQVLRSSIPEFEAARDSLEYAQAVARMISHIHDSHGFIRSAVLASFYGQALPGVKVDYIEHVPVIVGFTDEPAARAAGALMGDIILEVDGVPAADRVAMLAKLLAASTPQALEANLGWRLLRGADSSVVVLKVRGADGRTRQLSLQRSRANWNGAFARRTGEILRVLPGNIGYADLDRLPMTMVDSMFDRFRDTRAIIFDVRGYPLGTAWTIAPRLTDRNDVPAARFARPVADHPRGTAEGEMRDLRTTFEFTQAMPTTDRWRYHGQTVMLINGETISQAEHTGLFFEAANGTVFIGSPSAGANGDVTNFYVPGGLLIYFSGQSVRHADGRQLQRIGLQPTVLVQPTIAGIRAGRDEVLERALAYLGAPSR